MNKPPAGFELTTTLTDDHRITIMSGPHHWIESEPLDPTFRFNATQAVRLAIRPVRLGKVPTLIGSGTCVVGLYEPIQTPLPRQDAPHEAEGTGRIFFGRDILDITIIGGPKSGVINDYGPYGTMVWWTRSITSPLSSSTPTPTRR